MQKNWNVFLKQISVYSLFMSLFFCTEVSGQFKVLQLNADTLSGKMTGYSLNTQKWAFQNGDNARWALPGYSDTNWLKVTANFGKGNELREWQGIGWFRLWVQVDTGLTQRALGLRMNHDGASEIYIDGYVISQSHQPDRTGKNRSGKFPDRTD